MRRTTLAFDDALFRLLKKRATDEGRSLQDLVNDLVRQALMPRRKPGYKLKLHGWQAREQPGVDLLDRDKLFDLMDGR